MSTASVALSTVLLVASVAGAADPQATFLGGATYAAAADCAMVAARDADATAAITASPRILTASGYSSVEGACRFVNIDERYKNRLWTVTLSCDRGGEAVRRVEVWRKTAEGRLTVTSGTTVSELVACPKRATGGAKK